jgi:hypothetical protein
MQNEELFLRKIREDIHSIIFSIDNVTSWPIFNKDIRDVDIGILLCYERLRMAKGWLGKHLGKIGTIYPYNPVISINDIPEETDVPEKRDLDKIIDPQKALLFFNDLRIEISVIIKKIESEKEHYFVNKAIDNLQEASMGLGLLIGSLRDEYKNKGKILCKTE